jgi:hypothetical protein
MRVNGRIETKTEIETANDPGAREKRAGGEAEAADGEVGGKRSGFRPEALEFGQSRCAEPSYTRLNASTATLELCDIPTVLT